MEVCGKSPGSIETRPTHQIFRMVKDADNISYCTKNQVCGLCVGGDMIILFLVGSMVKWPCISVYAHDFWYSNIYCQHFLPYQKSGGLAGLYVGGDSIQPGDLPHTHK